MVKNTKQFSKFEVENRAKAIQAALDNINNKFCKESIDKLVMRLGDIPKRNIEVIPTGIYTLDSALGVWGFPKGRIIEIYGNEGSAKTALSLLVIAQTQKAGGTAAFVDAEHAFDPFRAKKLGVNVKDLIISQPDYGEQALEVVEQLALSKAIDVIVVDSVAALTPKAEIEGNMWDSHMWLQARLMSQALRKLTSIIAKSNVILVFINQVRMKIGVMFGNPEITTWGNALKFYASIRIEMKKIETLGDKDEPTGVVIKAKVVKNKVAPPFKSAVFELSFKDGFVAEANLFDLAIEKNVIEKSGAWYSFNKTKLQGKESFVAKMKEDKALFETIKKAVFLPESNDKRN